MTTRRRKRRTPEQIVRKRRDADAMLNPTTDLAVVLQLLKLASQLTMAGSNQYGGMKLEEAKRLKELEEENKRLKQLVGEQALDIQMLKHITGGNW